MMALTTGRKAAILVGIVVFVVGSSTGVSFALWSTGATTTANVAAGTIGISANSLASAALTGLTSTQVGAGVASTTSVTITNTSSTLPMTYTTTVASTETPTNAVIGDNIDLVVWVTSAAANCTASASIEAPSWTSNLGSATATLGSGRALAARGSEVLCVRTTMKSTAPAIVGGQSVGTVLTFTGSSV